MTEESAIDRVVFDELLASIGGDLGFLSELIDVYVSDGCARLVELEQALAEGDLEVFRRAAHSLKSNSANFGARHLAVEARELETMARNGSLEGAQPKLAALSLEYTRVSDELGRLQRAGA